MEILCAFGSYIDPYKDLLTVVFQTPAASLQSCQHRRTLGCSRALQILVHASVLNLDMQSSRIIDFITAH